MTGRDPIRFAFASIADAAFLAVLVVAAMVTVTGGSRVGHGWYRVSLTNPVHILLAAVAIGIVRHAFVRRPSLLDRFVDWSRAPSDATDTSAAPGGLASPGARRAAVLGLPIATLRVGCAAFLAIATRLMLPLPGTGDVREFWLSWMHNLSTLGLVSGFAANGADYPPGTSVILWTVVRLAALLGVNDFTALKCSILLFLGLTSMVFWLWTRSFGLTVVLYAALLFPSVALGYLDVYFAPFLLAALWALETRRLRVFGVCFGLACVVKWQPLIVLPFVVVYVANLGAGGDTRASRRLVALGSSLWPAALLAVVITGVFGRPVLQALQSATTHPFLSGNALNFCWVITHWLRAYHPDAFGGLTAGQATLIVTTDPRYTLLPRTLFLLSYAAIVVLAFSRANRFADFLSAALLGYLSYFIFSTGVHENHLFLAVIVSIVLYWHDRTRAGTAVALVLLSTINLFIFYGFDGTGYPFGRVVAGTDVALLGALAATAFFLTLCARAVSVLQPRSTSA